MSRFTLPAAVVFVCASLFAIAQLSKYTYAQVQAQASANSCTVGTPCKFAADDATFQADGVTSTKFYKDGTFIGNATFTAPSLITFTYTFVATDVGMRVITVGVQNANPKEVLSDPLSVTIDPVAPAKVLRLRVCPATGAC